MKYIFTFVAALIIGWQLCAAQQPAAYKPVVVTVAAGDTMESIVCRLKDEYNDRRDWRYIAWQAHQDNTIGKYIHPGDSIVFRMEVYK